MTVAMHAKVKSQRHRWNASPCIAWMLAPTRRFPAEPCGATERALPSCPAREVRHACGGNARRLFARSAVAAISAGHSSRADLVRLTLGSWPVLGNRRGQGADDYRRTTRASDEVRPAATAASRDRRRARPEARVQDRTLVAAADRRNKRQRSVAHQPRSPVISWSHAAGAATDTHLN
jgi:hypothetical protein